MEWSGLQAGQTKLAQPLTDGAFMHLHRKPARDLLAQISASPADNLVLRWIRPVDDQRFQFGHLRLTQRSDPPWGAARFQAVDALLVVATHPISQGLPIHTSLSRSLGARTALQDQGDCQNAADLGAITASGGHGTKLCCRLVVPSYAQCCTHPVPPAGQSSPRKSESERRVAGKPSKSQPQRGLV